MHSARRLREIAGGIGSLTDIAGHAVIFPAHGWGICDLSLQMRRFRPEFAVRLVGVESENLQ